MSIENGNDGTKKQSPWARGDERERELGPIEVAKIRAERLKETGKEGIGMYESNEDDGRKRKTVVILGSVTTGKSESEIANMLRDRFKSEVSREIDYFRKLLGVRGTHTETFQLDHRGLIPVEIQKTYANIDVNTVTPEQLSAFGEKAPGLLVCTVPTAKPLKSGEEYSYRPDDLRFAALSVSERYPEASFEFAEDPTKGEFTYTATLTKPKE